jgi:hypothetical protein
MHTYQAKYATAFFLSILLSVGGPLSNHPATSQAQVVERGRDEKKPLRAVTFSFMGTVDNVRASGGLLDGSVQTGSRLNGTYTFDPSTPDSNKDPTVGDYQHRTAGYGLLIKIGKYEFKTDPAKVNFLLEVVARPERHNYLLRSYNNVSSGPGLAADAIDHISWQLDDPSGKAMASDAIPLNPPVLSKWRSVFGLTLDGRGDRRKGGRDELFIRGHVEFIWWDLPAPGYLVEPTHQRKLAAKELDGMWADLAGDDVARGYRAATALLADSGEAVPFLELRLKPKLVDAKRIARLLADLDSDRFEERAEATRELEALGESAEVGLRQALADQPSAEARRRLEGLVQKLNGARPSLERLRALRALKVLEHLASPGALKVLQELAKQEAKTWLAQEAKFAADRLSKRQAEKR